MASRHGFVVWLTGLSGAGKSTLAQALCEKLRHSGFPCEHLDGDSVRRELGGALGFSRAERELQSQRLCYIALLLTRHDVIVVVSAVSPYRDSRARARARFGNFLEVYVNAPVEECQRRDLKGLYARARSGGLSNLTGVDAPYESPRSPEVECRTDCETPEQSLAKIWAALGLRLTAPLRPQAPAASPSGALSVTPSR
ncbi:MAG: adenylyl-sulfate kinase [Burkholderiales bacterium]